MYLCGKNHNFIYCIINCTNYINHIDMKCLILELNIFILYTMFIYFIVHDLHLVDDWNWTGHETTRTTDTCNGIHKAKVSNMIVMYFSLKGRLLFWVCPSVCHPRYYWGHRVTSLGSVCYPSHDYIGRLQFQCSNITLVMWTLGNYRFRVCIPP